MHVVLSLTGADSAVPEWVGGLHLSEGNPDAAWSGLEVITPLPLLNWGGPGAMALAAAAGRGAASVGRLLGKRLRDAGATVALLPPLDPVNVDATGPLLGISDHSALIGRVASGLARGARAAGLRVLAPYRTVAPLRLSRLLADWEREERPALEAVLPEVDGIWLGPVPVGPVGDVGAATCAATVRGLLRGALGFTGLVFADLRGTDQTAGAAEAAIAAGVDVVVVGRSGIAAMPELARGGQGLPWRTAPASGDPLAESEDAVASALAKAALTLVRDRGFLPLRETVVVPASACAERARRLAAALGSVGSGNGTVLMVTEDAWHDQGQVETVRAEVARRGPERVGVLAVGNPGDLGLFPEVAFLAAVYDAASATIDAVRQALCGNGDVPWKGRMPVELGQQILVSGRPLGWVTTEQTNPGTMDLDLRTTIGVVEALLASESRVVSAVAAEVPAIAAGVELIVAAVRGGHRVFYTGAGSAGRIGVLDASEIPPTFGLAPYWFRGIMAGGDRAIRSSVEDAEDATAQAAEDMAREGVSAGDVLVAITAHGSTPYPMGAARYAREQGAFVIALVNNMGSQLSDLANVSIRPLCGPEPLVGSTRMNSGTSEKIVLNCLSTASMVALGKVYDNLMVDFRPSNRKLVARAEQVFMWVTGVSQRVARQALKATGYEVKLACAAHLTGLTPQEASQRLEASGGSLRAVVDAVQ